MARSPHYGVMPPSRSWRVLLFCLLCAGACAGTPTTRAPAPSDMDADLGGTDGAAGSTGSGGARADAPSPSQPDGGAGRDAGPDAGSGDAKDAAPTDVAARPDLLPSAFDAAPNTITQAVLD